MNRSCVRLDGWLVDLRESKCCATWDIQGRSDGVMKACTCIYTTTSWLPVNWGVDRGHALTAVADAVACRHRSLAPFWTGCVCVCVGEVGWEEMGESVQAFPVVECIARTEQRDLICLPTSCALCYPRSLNYVSSEAPFSSIRRIFPIWLILRMKKEYSH